MHFCPHCHCIVTTVRKVIAASKKAVFKCLWCGTVLTTLFVADLHEPPEGVVPESRQIYVINEGSSSVSASTTHIFALPSLPKG